MLVDYHDSFARHRIDIELNTEFKVKLIPKDDKVLYSQIILMLNNLKEDQFVVLAPMHNYGIITVLTSSKYANPIIAQRNSNGKLRLLVNLRKVSSLFGDDYSKNNHPASPLSDAARDLASNSLFCKLDCSRAYDFADGGRVISGNACIQVCFSNFCLQKTCTRYQQICLCIFKFHAQVIEPSCRS